MDVNLELIYPCLALLATILFLQKFTASLLNPKKKKNLPPSPPSLPILGHVHLFKSPYHRRFWALAQKHGPIFSLRLGCRLALVVSSPSAAKECFTQNDVVFANRPKFLSGQYLAYDNTLFIWAPYGAHWRNVRRVITLFGLTTKQIERASPTRRAEIQVMVQDLIRSSEGGTKNVNLNMIFGKLTRSLLMRMLNGKSWEYPIIITPSPHLITICDFVPVLRWVGYKGIMKEMLRDYRKKDGFVQMLIDECRKTRAFRRTRGGQGHVEEISKTMIEELLDLQEAEPGYYTDYILKGIILAMVVAGSDTSARTLEWAMALLMNHPEVLEKARIEIETHVDHNRLVDDSDLSKLTYIGWIIDEILRLFPPTPLLLPHCSSEDCTIGGYHVPKGTMLFVNAWAMHRDPTLWEEPNKFKPERFEKLETDQGRFKYMYMPFGVGRRSCPGNNWALRNVTLALATLIQCFQWEITDESQKMMIDLAERGGSTDVMSKDKPLEAICRPRSSMAAILQSLSSEYHIK